VSAPVRLCPFRPHGLAASLLRVRAYPDDESRLTRLKAGLPQFLVAKRASLASSRLSVLERGYES
jgi:hypothetical protein